MLKLLTSLIFILNLSFATHAKTLPIAHRGASAYAPENTISSIKKAIELGSKFIEIDVHMTKDGEVVAIHDSTIDRTSNYSGSVADFTIAQLRGHDFGTWFSKEFSKEKIPTLKEVLKVLTSESILIIELKYGADTYPEIEKKIVDTVVKMGLSKNVILKSFSYEILNTFEKIAPNIDRLYCTFWGNSWLTIDNFLRFKGIFDRGSFKYLQVHKFFLTKDLVDKAHEKGIKVVVWDVHDKESMKEFQSMGVDFIESDNPDYVIEIQKNPKSFEKPVP